MQGPDRSCCNRQHNGGFLYQQAGWYEVRLSLCRPMEAYVLVPPQRNSPEGKAHSRLFECNSGQALLTQSNNSNRIVPISAGIQSFVLQMGPTTDRLVCNPVQSQTSQVCVTGAGSNSLGSRCPQSSMEEYGCVCIPSSLPDHSSGLQDGGSGLSQDMILITPGWQNMPRFLALVNLSVQIPFGLPLIKDLVRQLFNGLVHKNLSNLNLHAWLLESLPSENKGCLMKWQK